MNECYAIERPDGGISVIHPNWNRYATDLSILNFVRSGRIFFRQFIPDIAEFFVWETVKQPMLLGRRFGFHDVWADRNRMRDMERAYRLARDRASLIMDRNDLLERNIRRNAWRFNYSVTGLVDDRHITTEQEVMAALTWHQAKLIESGSLSNQTLRKIAWGRFDLIKVKEADPYIYEWRMKGDAPECSRFLPPSDALLAPVPSDFLRKVA